MSDNNVITLKVIPGGRTGREKPLSDSELVQVRRMLREHEVIVETCPIARRAAEAVAEE